MFHTQSQLKALLGEAGTAPRHRLGQNFLIDQNLMLKLVDAAELCETDCVLEVGTGTGSLTSLLAERAGRVITVELDKTLAVIAQENLAAYDNVISLNLDALKNKSTVHPDLLEQLETAIQQTSGQAKLVANLPYDIATSLVINLLLTDIPFRNLCFTVQTEVADRFLAESNTNDYGPVSIIAQILSVGERITRVPPSAFWPAPKVSSSMVKLSILPTEEVPVRDARDFAAFVRSFFLHRRKTLTRIAKSLDDADKVLAAIDAMGIDGKARPEQLSPADWIRFHTACK